MKPQQLPLGFETDDLEVGERRHHTQKLGASSRGMVATAHYRATDAAVEILERGGNAVDAAVAGAFALGVCEPAASGLGGQTMMLIHLTDPKRTFALDGSSRAPNRVTPDLLGSKERRRGYRATTVPSTPATLGYALREYGRLDLGEVLKPAISLAQDGFEVTELLNHLSRREAKFLRKFNGAEIFLRGGKHPYRVGDVLRQPILSKTLRRLAREGIEDFYQGGIARRIHRDMQRSDGLLHLDDLARIPWPIKRKPVSGNFGKLRVRTFPPPGAGRTLIEMLNIIQQFPAKWVDPETPRGALILANVIRQAFLDRKDRPFDPGFYAQVTEREMISLDRAKKLARGMRKRIKTHGETTHLSVMDADGNAVALTQSIERVFGSCVVTPELGFLYNNYMMAYEFEDISHPYYLRPNASPWASVAPTLVFRSGRPWLAIGSPGSERITPSILQVLLRLEHMSPLAAVDAPRLHCSAKGKVSLEAARMRDDIPETLRAHGFEIDVRNPHSFYLGCIQLVMRDRKTFIGVADPRRDGSARGPSGSHVQDGGKRE